ncbi:MAG: putative RNA methyltransferase [Solirubrobacterales bacterium]
MAEIEQFLDWLACPVCGGDLSWTDDGLACPKGHSFDIAKQGYANLLGPQGKTHTADRAEMLDARTRVLGAGLFDPVTESIREILVGFDGSQIGGPVVDLGTGTGFHLERALEELPDMLGLGLDNSKYAARRGARCHPRAAAAVADVWEGLPLKDGSVSVLLDVFAPRNGPEIQRVLSPGGIAVVVTGAPDHLAGIPEGFGMITVDPEKRERLARTMEGFDREGDPVAIEWTMSLTPDEVADLVRMGPGAGRVGPEAFEAEVEALPERTEVLGRAELHLFTVT